MTIPDSHGLQATADLITGRLRETGRFFRAVREAENVLRIEPLAAPFDGARLGAIILSDQGAGDLWARAVLEFADEHGPFQAVVIEAVRIDGADDEALAEIADHFASPRAVAA